MGSVTVRYYSVLLLRTIDMNRLLERLASEVPECLRVVIEVMPDEERGGAARVGPSGIIEVRERIHIFVSANGDGDGGALVRLRDLEEEAERFSP